MDALDSLRARVWLVPGVRPGKRHLVHPLNGRFHPVDQDALERLVESLAARCDTGGVDYVLGFPEGGSIPAYAFARAARRPVVLASRLPLDVPGRIAFEEPHAVTGTTQYLYGLAPGHRVLIVEDELTNGHTALSAVAALRGAGIAVDQIITLFAIDHPGLWRRVKAAGVTVHVGLLLPPELAPRPLDP